MFYIVDKPLGISSNLVAKILKRVLNQSRMGFAGTLDPLASGLMIIGTSGSSRLFPLIEHLTKTYETNIRLDGTTASYDLEEPIENIQISEALKTIITQKYLEEIIQKNFTGEILQSPPLYSAVWLDGQRAYELARRGETRTIDPKKRTIYEFQIIDYKWPTLKCKITVSHGTYIRSIARDMGEILGTGGYIEKLRRTEIGHIDIKKEINWISHNDISYAPLKHEELFPEIPVLDLSDADKKHLRLGSTPIPTRENNGYYFIHYDDSYGLMKADEGFLFPLKNVV